MTAQAIGFVIRKAPKGGYALSRILNLDGGTVQLEEVAYTSSLIEAQAIEHQEKRQMFGEPAWYGPQPQQYQQQPMLPASSVMPPSSPDIPDDGSLPKFASDYAANGGATGALYERLNGVMRAWVPMLFIAGVWLTANARFVV